MGVLTSHIYHIKVYQMFLVKLWSNYIVQNAWMYTRQNHQDITILMVHTLALAFHICCSWFIQSIDQNEVQTSLYQGWLLPFLFLHHRMEIYASFLAGLKCL